MKRVAQSVLGALILVGLAGLAGAQRPVTAGKISILSQNPFQLHIQTSAPVSPQVQLVSNPERLVIDLPNTTPAAGFRGIPVERGEIRGVRTSIFSTQPLISRVVVDLKSPHWYQVQPDASGLTVMLGSDPTTSGNTQSTIGWVTTKASPASASLQRRALMAKPPAATLPAPTNGVSVQFANGMLSIHANNASLSEVLYQIQKKTGAEIAIPSGTEQDRVAADFGPGTPNEVLAELLNGSRLNFVVIGSEASPDAIRSVILTRKGADADPPATIVPTYTPAESSENVVPDNPEQQAVAPAPLPQQQVIPANGPPPEPPQD